MSMVEGWIGMAGGERKRRITLIALIVGGLLAIAAGALLLPDAKPEGEAVAAARVEGFRTARFGDDEKAVRAAIATDFGKMGEAVKIVDNPVERTRVLVVRAPNLFADAGEAEIGYVIGYKSKALIQVNLLWGTPLTPAVTRAQLNAVAATLMRYFGGQGFAPQSVTRNRPLGKNGVLVFQGSDARGHMVQLVRRSEAPALDKADAAAPRMTLRLAYIADAKTPDIFRIADGAF
ncbi:MAG: hypothetical protein K8R18_02375 [Parvibaculum sp.]|uniref:hypothetical protein n=1 Tax=Parvibaculum sp. TaxID=2024848 RepID=UPI0025D658C4|nr:hypothetical protein [Parvibaculum sp.]MCE9648447.1 hypothetical protein [Parvibaculum sp.]